MSEELKAFKRLKYIYVIDKETYKNDLEVIEKALKRNEPLKVNHKEDKGVTTVGTCGCGGLVSEVNDNYCSLCGQRLDWD